MDMLFSGIGPSDWRSSPQQVHKQKTCYAYTQCEEAGLLYRVSSSTRKRTHRFKKKKHKKQLNENDDTYTK